jgi:hypothetical protein
VEPEPEPEPEPEQEPERIDTEKLSSDIKAALGSVPGMDAVPAVASDFIASQLSVRLGPMVGGFSDKTSDEVKEEINRELWDIMDALPGGSLAAAALSPLTDKVVNAITEVVRPDLAITKGETEGETESEPSLKDLVAELLELDESGDPDII